MALSAPGLIFAVVKRRDLLLVPWQGCDVDQAQERDGQRFSPVDQPLEYGRCDIGQTQLSADLSF